MSKPVGKPKVTIELPKAKNLSDRLSVFQRLGNRGGASGSATRHKLTPLPPISDKEGASSAQEESTSAQLQPQIQQQPEEPFPNASLKLQLVRQKAAEIMDSKRKQEQVPPPSMTVVKKVRKVRISSPSSDSSSTSSSSSSSSTSSPKRKVKKRQIRKRAPSSSSDEVRERKISKKKAHKKSLEMKKAHHKKSKEMTRNLIKRAISPPASYSRRHEESESPPKKIIVKVHKKEKVHKYHEAAAAMVERDRELYEREKLRAKERMRSPSPKMVMRRSRSPRGTRIEMKRVPSPEMRRSPPRSYRSRERSDDRSPYKESRGERERRERREYEMMREKERAEALARCQERQRERERLKAQREMEEREKYERGRPRSVERGRPIPRSRSRSYERHEVLPPQRDYERRYEEPVVRGRVIEERSPVGREFRRVESPPQERRRYEYEEPSPHHRDSMRRSHGDYQERQMDHRQHDDRRVNYERAESHHPSTSSNRGGEWIERESGHKTPMQQQQYHERRPNYEEKEHWTPKERPPYNKQYHDTPRPYNDPSTSSSRQQDSTPHHLQHTTHTPRGGMVKKYNPDWQQQQQHHPGSERTPSYRPRGGFVPRHERPDTQSYRPRGGFVPRGGGFRPSGPRMPGSFRGRGNFHPNITYFPSRNPHPNSQQIQHPGSPMQGSNSSDASSHPKQMLRRQDGADEGDHLSEISDEGDDVLGKPEGRGMNRVRIQQRHRQQVGGLMEPKNAGDPSVKQETETGIDTKSHANKQLQEEMELDFEEISDGELDEENRKICLGDALGVDWSSIVEESKRKVKEESQLGVNSAKQKLKPYRVLLDIGISSKMAGEDFAKQVICDSYACLEEEIREEIHVQALNEFTIKNEYDGKDIKGEPENVAPETPDETKPTKVGVSLESMEQKLSEKLPFTTTGLLDQKYAFAQVAYKERLESRKKLLINAIGPYSRALSARQDLKIRRRLCGLPEEEVVEKASVPITPVETTNVTVDPVEGDTAHEVVAPKQSSMEIAFGLFKKAIGKVC